MSRGFKGPHTEKTKRILSLKNRGKHSSPATEFKKGMVPWNAGLKRRGIKYAYRHNSSTKFKPGNRPKNWLPVGTITIRIDTTTGNPYHLIKIKEPKTWQYLSRHVWENSRGRKILPGFVIYHMDGISLNDDPSNLTHIPRSVHINFLKMDIENFESKRISRRNKNQHIVV
ncbi:hypothetical protein ES705_05321 [subsurface metagenome]